MENRVFLTTVVLQKSKNQAVQSSRNPINVIFLDDMFSSTNGHSSGYLL